MRTKEGISKCEDLWTWEAGISGKCGPSPLWLQVGFWECSSCRETFCVMDSTVPWFTSRGWRTKSSDLPKFWERPNFPGPSNHRHPLQHLEGFAGRILIQPTSSHAWIQSSIFFETFYFIQYTSWDASPVPHPTPITSLISISNGCLQHLLFQAPS
jgi:hypothetical protein